MPLRRFLNKHFAAKTSDSEKPTNKSTAYVFDHKFLNTSGIDSSLQSENNLVSRTTDDEISWIFALGKDGQGIPFHSHHDSFAMQCYGIKRWAVYGLGQMTPTTWVVNENFARWLQKRRGGDLFKPPTWECIQKPGDLYYVPEGFWHATMSIGDSVAIVGQASEYHRPSAAWYQNEAIEMKKEDGPN